LKTSANTAAKLTLQIMKDLHKYWKPHEGQIEALKPLYDTNTESNLIFTQCGRKFGKTDLAVYCLWRHALLNPGSMCYYIGPQLDHARKLIWNNRRLQKFGCERDERGNIVPGGEDALNKYIDKVNESKSVIKFKNGSRIEIIGSENWGAANGLTPDFVVYDEFKMFKRQWHTEFNPNRIAKAAPLVIIGTPPKPGDLNKEEYIAIAEQAKQREDQHHIIRDSFCNPHIDPKETLREIEALKERGDHDVIEREYFGKLVYGGAASIFPMLNRDRHVHKHSEMMYEIRRDLKKMDWFCITDPGTTTCFAALIGCINPYTKQIYLLDELYETDQLNTSTRKMVPQMQAKARAVHPRSDFEDDWYKVYDEAAAWFANETMDQFGIYFTPTAKHMNKKEHGISLVKDILIHDLVKISDRCIYLIKEMLEYVKDDKGNIPKKDDHLIDCFRYLLAHDGYNMVEAIEVIKQKDSGRGHSRSLDNDWKWKEDQLEDWTKIADRFWE